ncbi:helix-turn-helix transcriptional regulator [Fibrobacter sp.]|uniref:helix-turn-helix transcriptional regulator n=1 Tax=Fibrobacter sp. TaxID=35828 RepID=UPI003869AAD0
MRRTEKPVSFRVEGENIPKAVLAFLDALFPDHVRIDDDEDLVAVEDTDWYKKAKAKMTPAKALKIMRTNAGLTQMQLAEKIGIAKQNYNSLERGARPISMMMAKKLADALGTSYTMFYED